MENSEERKPVSIIVGDKLYPYCYDVCVGGIYYCLNKEYKLAQVVDGEIRYSGVINIPEIILVDGEIYAVVEIGVGAFWGCQEVTSVHIPDSIVKIGDEAFLLCTNMKEVNIPSSVMSVGHNAFGRCDSLPCENGLEYADTYLLAGISAPVIEIKPGTRFIGAYALNNAKAKSLIIPDTVISYGVESIHDNHFDEIHVKNPVPVVITNDYSFPGGNSWWYDCDGNFYLSKTKLYVPAGTKEKYATADGWCNFSEIIEE